MASYTKHDLEFILAQIKIAEADVAGGAAINQVHLVGDPLLPHGLRTVTGEQNNLVALQNEFGAVDNVFPRLLTPVFKTAEGATFDPDGPGPLVAGSSSSYTQTSGLVFDSQPRTISNLIADQTLSNPAAIVAAHKNIGSADPAADAQTVLNATNVALAAAAAAAAAQVAATTANANQLALQTGNPALIAALVAAQGANTTAQTNKAISQSALTTAQSNKATAQLELTAAQSAASATASALTLANNNVTSTTLLANSTAAQAATNAGLAASALTASNNAAAAAVTANAAEAAALVTYINTVASATAGSPEIAAALAAYNAAIAAAGLANTAASNALSAYGVATATAAASAQSSIDTAAAQAAAQAIQTPAFAANELAQAALSIEQGLLSAASDAATLASANLLTANNTLAAANQLVTDTAAQAAADLATFGEGSPEAIASAELAAAAVAAQVLAQTAQAEADAVHTSAQAALTAAQVPFDAAVAMASGTLAALSLANGNLGTATTTASNAATQAATDLAAKDAALIASNIAAADAVAADSAKAAALVTYNASIVTFGVGSPAAVAALGAYNIAIAASDTATFNAFTAQSASGTANATEAASAQAASNAADALTIALTTQASAVSANALAQPNLITEQNEFQVVADAEAAALSTFNGLSSIAAGTAAALTLAEDAASAGNSALAAAISAANDANAALTAANSLATTTQANADQITFDLGLQFSPNGTISIPNKATDEGLSAQYNSWFTLFGQFFDHGLDSTAKGGSGTVFIPLKPDDPLYVVGSNSNFMVLTRATNQPGPDGILGNADDVHEVINTVSPFIDQNQTYSSHPSHQVFLRAYTLVGGVPEDTGELIENRDLGADGVYGTADDILLGGMATWAVVKAQARDILGINLTDANVTGGPLLATDDYGNFLPGANGLPQLVTSTGLVEGNLGAPVNAATAIRGGYAFLDDIAHNAAPGTFDHDNNPATPRIAKTADADNIAGGPVATGQYDNELLDAHYIAGDGRVNENIGLITVHSIFHSEHNRLVHHTKDVVLASADLAFINEWLSTDLVALPTPAQIAGLDWDGQRLFQAAKFGTEMQYQHLAFEEFARKIQVQVDVFAGYDSTINPAIVAEFAHVVYRFGHSMLNESVDRFDANFNLVNGTTTQIGLIEAFLNPLEFAAGGIDPGAAAGAIVRGMTRQVANELDEFVTEALRNNLLGLPLDLAALNIARARETGVPGLNAARREFFAGTLDAQLKPYVSWVDFANNIKHAESAINFIAAYGTHAQLLLADVNTMVEKRDVAFALVMGGSATINAGTAQQRIFTANETDRLDFLNSTGIYANLAGGVTTTGVDAIDFWMGGLAERQMPFGGLLGSTFNFVFETQMEKLQDGDRFYYLARTAGLNFLTELEANSFASMIMRNTDVTRLPGDVFSVPNFILEVDQTKQFTGLGVTGRDDPTGGTIFTSLVVRNDPSTPGLDTNYLKFTGGEHVVLGGTAGNDTLIASIGDDTIWGDAGDDRIEGGDGVDILNGGDGNDIITDLGGDDNIKGGEGDDVISGGNGFDLILAGGGSDFIVAGEDPKEVFANQGNDFILGSSTFDVVFGDQGDDWIDGGASADFLQGDMGDPFPTSTIIGNDVIIGGGGTDDYHAESGDDIMVMGAGTQRAEGMLGFDWVTHKNQGVGADADLAFTGLLPPDVENLKDRFDNVEGISGWNLNDTLRGDSFGSVELLTEAVVGNVRTNHALNNAQQISLINGLQGLLDGMLGAGQTGFSAGNIMLGGGGSDIMEGRGGNDLIDGDAWLNVRIAVSGHPTITSAESMAEIAPLLFSGEIKPSQLSIMREILTTNNVGDVDTVVFSGDRVDYTITSNANGTFTVAHTNVQPGVADDGIDTVRNIENFRFANGTVTQAQFANIAPVVTSNAGAPIAVAVNENTTAVLTTVTATDVEAQPITYSISSVVAATNADAAKFAVNATTGALSFITPPNFEVPTDVGADNVYNVVVQASDGSLFDTQEVVVTVNNLLEVAPVITSNGGGATAAINVAENRSVVTAVTATDPDVRTVFTYSISGGVDAARFVINPTTGALRFITPSNFEAPTDVGANNVYNVIVQVVDTDGLIDTQAIAVTVTNANDAPVITSNTGRATAAITINENTTAVTTVTATDADAGTVLTYSLAGGADAARFAINASTGALSFIVAPDFEIPSDVGANNIYDVIVRVSDGTLIDTQAIAVTVANVNEAAVAPVITSNAGGATAAVNVAENSVAVTTVTATDANGGVLTYSLSAVVAANNADAALFAINPTTGALSFVGARNFEAPTDAGANGVYNVVVQVSDASGLTDTQEIAVTVTNVNEAPVITSNLGGPTATTAINENTTAVTTVVATDVDAGSVLTYTLAGGLDAARFALNATTGALSFIAAPDFEIPSDVGGNNIYDVIVQVSDAGGLIDTQAIAVTVANVNEVVNVAPVITSNGGAATAATAINENTTAVTTVTATDANAGTVFSYSLAGGLDAARFAINATTGALSFIAAPDFEIPSDVGGNNIYDVIVQVSDGTLTDTQAIAVTVNNVVEAVNAPPTGALNISSYTRNAASTSASFTATNTLNDINGMTGFVPFQWQQLTAGVWGNIAGATAATLANRVNATVRVTSSYTDTFGLNSFVSDQTAIIGTTASTTIAGLAGNDIMLGLAGNDILTASTGNDTIDGGIGTDTYSLATTTANATVNLTTNTSSSAETGVDTLLGIETVIGGAGNDSITDGVGANELQGGSGNDVLIVTNDNARDILRGNAGVDTVDYSVFLANLTVNLGGTNDVLGSGTAGNLDNINNIQNIISGAGNDSILGDTLVNNINGGGGNDTITGGGGADLLTGGTGADVFAYALTTDSGVGAGRDVIADFVSGTDKLDFSAMDANTLTVLPANEAFTFIGTGAFTAAAQIRYQLIDTDANGSLDSTLVRGNVNAGLGADFEVLLQGVTTAILATDIIL